jgi:branched-chain amino acid aminotransferase
LKDPGFGKVFTDHMVTIRWTRDRGWHDAEVRAPAPIALERPALRSGNIRGAEGL